MVTIMSFHRLKALYEQNNILYSIRKIPIPLKFFALYRSNNLHLYSHYQNIPHISLQLAIMVTLIYVLRHIILVSHATCLQSVVFYNLSADQWPQSQ